MIIDDSWNMWMNSLVHNPPKHGLLIQLARKEWPEPVTCLREDILPEMNAFGLYWRLTGIARFNL